MSMDMTSKDLAALADAVKECKDLPVLMTQFMFAGHTVFVHKVNGEYLVRGITKTTASPRPPVYRNDT